RTRREVVRLATARGHAARERAHTAAPHPYPPDPYPPDAGTDGDRSCGHRPEAAAVLQRSARLRRPVRDRARVPRARGRAPSLAVGACARLAFSVEGSLELVKAVVQGIAIRATDYQLGAAWFIPTYAVPLLWVSQAMIFLV